jgi:hypothetical protein
MIECEYCHMWQAHKASLSALLFADQSGYMDDQLPKQLAQKYLLIHYCFYIRESHLISDSLVHVLMAGKMSLICFLSVVLCLVSNP